MLDHIKNESVLFVDIETAPAAPSFDQLNDAFKDLWDKKSSYFRKENESAKDVYSRAGIYAEFGKIICISAGFIYMKGNEKCLRLKSFSGDDEKELLTGFADMINKFCDSRKEVMLCAHNGKEFDFPYIARRMLVLGVRIPQILDNAGKKPWEVSLLDTLELWKFGDYKHYTSLNLLANLFNIPTPKDDMDGSMVGEAYWQRKELERITKYCEKDVLAIAQLFLRYKGESIILDANIEQAGLS